MSATIPTTAIRLRVTTAPTQTAAAGVIAYNTATGAVYIQQTVPTGTNWAVVGSGVAPGAYARATTYNSHALFGSYQRV